MKTKKSIFVILVAMLSLSLLLGACTGENTDNPSDSTSNANATVAPKATDNGNSQNYVEEFVAASDKFTDFDRRISFGQSTDVKVTLSDGGKTSITGDGATVSGDVITINKAGVYVFSGKLSNGQIIVDVEKTEKVQIVLNGVSITCKSSAAIWIKSADKVAITLAKNTENELSDGTTYANQNEKSEPSACIFSKDDLTINGYGKLTVNGNFNNGIATKNDFKFVSGDVTVKAQNNGIKGKDSISINSGTLTVISQDDGIKSDEDSKTDKGYVVIEGGDVTITAEDDAITAYNSVIISGGKVTTYANGKAINCDGTEDIKAGCLITK